MKLYGKKNELRKLYKMDRRKTYHVTEVLAKLWPQLGVTKLKWTGEGLMDTSVAGDVAVMTDGNGNHYYIRPWFLTDNNGGNK